MTQHDLHTPNLLRTRDGEPPFLEPWHAQATAMANLLVDSGQISPGRWAAALGAEIAASAANSVADDANAYFGAVLSALERLLDDEGAVSAAELHEREHAWERAYLRTPHGQPVTLD